MSHNDSDKDKKNPSHDIRTIRFMGHRTKRFFNGREK